MYFHRGSICAGLAAAVIGLGAASASAQVLYNNTAQATVGSDSITQHNYLSASFLSGPAAGTLNDVMLVLSAATPSDGYVTNVSLYSFTTALAGPQTLLATLGQVADSVLSSTPSVVDVTVTTPVLLAANTEYWIELTDSFSGGLLTSAGTPTTSATSVGASWGYELDDTGTGVAGQVYTQGTTGGANINGAYQMAVTEVPEPASWLVMLAGVIGLAGLRRRFS